MRKEKKDHILRWTLRVIVVILLLLLLKCGGTPGCRPEEGGKKDLRKEHRTGSDRPALSDDVVPSISERKTARRKEETGQEEEPVEKAVSGVASPEARLELRSSKKSPNAAARSAGSPIVLPLPGHRTEEISPLAAEPPESAPAAGKEPVGGIRPEGDTMVIEPEEKPPVPVAPPADERVRTVDVPSGQEKGNDRTRYANPSPKPASSAAPSAPIQEVRFETETVSTGPDKKPSQSVETPSDGKDRTAEMSSGQDQGNDLARDVDPSPELVSPKERPKPDSTLRPETETVVTERESEKQEDLTGVQASGNTIYTGESENTSAKERTAGSKEAPPPVPEIVSAEESPPREDRSGPSTDSGGLKRDSPEENLLDAAGAITRKHQVEITNVTFYRTSSGGYEARIVLRNITNLSTGRVNSNEICAQSMTGETVCAERARPLKVKQREAFWLMFGKTDSPLVHIYIRD